MSRSAARLLVVEDDSSARSALTKLLTARGFQVQNAEDGQAALEVMAELPFDVVITDIDMPRMNGMQLIAEVRRQYPGVSLIVTTYSVELAAAVSEMRAGAADYIAKPIELDELLLAIERELESQGLRVENEMLRRQVRQQSGEGIEGLVG